MLTREKILEGIEHISAMLKGPEKLSSFDRLDLHEERKDLRRMLANLNEIENEPKVEKTS